MKLLAQLNLFAVLTLAINMNASGSEQLKNRLCLAQTSKEITKIARSVTYNPDSEFANKIGSLIFTANPKPNNMMNIATEVFLARLAWSKENDISFYLDYNDKWQHRLAGEAGYGKHTTLGSPYMLSIPNMFHDSLPIRHVRDPLQLWGPMRILYFPSPIDRHFSEPYFLIARRIDVSENYEGDKYLVLHAASKDIPLIIKSELEPRWRKAINSRISVKARLEAIAELEWLYYWTNPMGRSGALTGRVLSLVMQYEIHKTYPKFKPEEQFDYYDQIALTSPFAKYTLSRLAVLTSRLAR